MTPIPADVALTFTVCSVLFLTQSLVAMAEKSLHIGHYDPQASQASCARIEELTLLGAVRQAFRRARRILGDIRIYIS